MPLATVCVVCAAKLQKLTVPYPVGKLAGGGDLLRVEPITALPQLQGPPEETNPDADISTFSISR